MSRPPRNPTGKGGFRAGQSGNPSGRSAEEVAAAKALNAALRADDMRVVGLKAYRELLEQRNPVIVKDFVDRVAGKAREIVEVSGPEGSPLSGLTTEELRAYILAKRGG